MTISKANFSVENLPNGYIRIDSRESGLVGLYNQDLSHYCGDLRLSKESVFALTR